MSEESRARKKVCGTQVGAQVVVSQIVIITTIIMITVTAANTIFISMNPQTLRTSAPTTCSSAILKTQTLEFTHRDPKALKTPNARTIRKSAFPGNLAEPKVQMSPPCGARKSGRGLLWTKSLEFGMLTPPWFKMLSGLGLGLEVLRVLRAA